MFEKTLTDIVKGIRASKRDTALYISQCVKEIKQEINSTDLYVKANALNKLTFLQMMGYDMSWASFATIEVMSSPRFAHKRIGYLAACQGFTQDTEVVLLTTNLLQKELRSAATISSGGVYEAGLAINCISNIVTEDLARDLLPEVTSLLNHPQPYLRKKTVLCLFKLFLKYPQGLRVTFDKIQLCLEDSNPSVVSCAVNVVTELSDANPKNYLHLAPSFFGLLTQSQNNWMLIKVVKLLGGLVPEEPRLARKLLEPLAQIVQTTQAKSLLYEACYTITLCLPYCRKADGSMPSIVPQIIQLCGKTFREFLADQDQNLKYLGLVGFCSLLISHPKILVEIGTDVRPLILKCLSDDDITIRTRALDLLRGMTSRKNLVELIGQLLQHVEAASGQYRKDLVLKVVELCSADKYALLQDFDWYFRILLNLAQVSPIAEVKLEKQILDVALRVLPVRAYAVQECTKLLLLQGTTNVLPPVMSSMAWIVGEYSDLLTGRYAELVKALMVPSPKIDTTTRSVFVQAAMKVFSASTQKAKSSEIEECVGILTKYLPVYTQSLDVEVQERSFTGLELLKSLGLTSSALDTPGLEESDVEEDDMLGMGRPAQQKPPKKTSSSLASRCRSAASTLNYIFKPEPMKPISAKAQRKKRQNPLGGITSEYLDKPLDMSIFEEILYDTINAAKPSMEQVSFTQQRPLTSAPVVAKSVASSDVMPSSSAMESPIKYGKSALETASTQSTSLNQTRSSADPFYLDSGTQASQNYSGTVNRFGTIQLLNSDTDDDEDGGKKKKKEKKKKKRATQQPMPAIHQTIYASDEENDSDEDNGFLSSAAPKQRKSSKDRGGLAQIDLTTPLGADESIMPNREHRVVPERSAQGVATQDTSGGKKKKKKKKESKKAKKEAAVGVGVGDLLDLGGFSSLADVSNPTAPINLLGTQSTPPVASQPEFVPRATAQQTPMSIMATTQSTPISSAFDDLLGLETVPSPAVSMAMGSSLPALMAPVPAIPPTKKAGKKAWLRSTIKTANAEGSAVNWSQVSLYHKVSPTSQPNAVGVVFRIESAAPIRNVTLTLRDSGEVISFGTVLQGSKAQVKIGPIEFENGDNSKELKGFLSSDGSSRVPIKFVLPASVYLIPPSTQITLDSAMAELSSEPFGSNSSKIPLTMDFAKAKSVLAGFFGATVVDDNVGGAAMLASQSTRGAKVRVLVKQKDASTVKVDIKCNNATLGTNLASDVKKLVL